MKIQLNQMNKRIPTDSIYNVILTLIIAFAIVWIIYVSTPYSHSNIYLIEQKKNNSSI